MRIVLTIILENGRSRRTARLASAVIVIVAGLVIVGCASSTRVASRGAPVGVVATTTQLADFARVLGGDRVRVTALLKPNIDAHDYEPSPADIDALRRASVVVRNGVGLDPWLDDAIDASGSRAAVVDASAGVTLRRPSGNHVADPHIWLDPDNARRMVDTLAAALGAAAPDLASAVDASRAAYDRDLQQLDTDIAGELAPISNRDVVTNHDAFGYFCDRYGLRIVGSVIPSFDSQAELSARELMSLVAKVRASGVSAIFAETSLPAKAAAALAREAHVRVVQGDGALYGDSLGPKGSDGDTYLKMMRHNARTFVENLAAGA